MGLLDAANANPSTHTENYVFTEIIFWHYMSNIHLVHYLLNKVAKLFLKDMDLEEAS